MATIKTLGIHADHAGAFKATARIRDHTLVLDQPPPIGTNAGAMPLELLETALAGCFVGTAHLIAWQRKIALRSIAVE